ncbi:hypothetical protein [Mucilaginibacter sp.]|jgi:hypothetical protein|uniref:hypothetical protein n=1 Tax=Mucilaginibacter sp. TaxID=1882438 RepID=UPI002CE7F876|nr:hypothetical protein [Mucilaginibacter sp.]HTI60520.1 hypothetical protein [Mucilaginibacter sp.]
MKYLFCLTVLSFLIFQDAEAQHNYRPAYIVDLKSDTLKGFIDYKEWENNPKQISFKSNLNQSAPTQFSAANMVAFGINGAEYYHKFIVSKSKGQTNPNKLSIGIDTGKTTDTAFLKVVVAGKSVSLFSLTDDIKTRYYITSTEDRQAHELDYYIFYIAENNVKVQTLFTFRNQLKLVADHYNKDSAKLTEDIKYANYRERDLREVVDLINGESSQSFTPPGVFGARVFAGAGARFNKLNAGGGGAFFPNGTNQSVTSPVVSAGADFFLNKYTKKFVFRAEIEYSGSHFTIPSTVIDGGGTTASLDFKQYNVSVVPQVIYNVYSTDQFKVFLDGGIALNFSSYNKYAYQVNFNNVSTTSTPNYPALLHYWNMFRLGTGVVIGEKVQINASYGLSAPISSSHAYDVKISYYQFGVNYLF